MITPRSRIARVASTAAAAGVLAVGLAGCNGILHPDDYPLNGPTATATSNPAEIRKGDLGRTWNLTVDHGTISCEMNKDGDPVLRFTTPDGTVYALNASDDNKALPDIEKISDGSVGTLRTFAFTVCSA